MRIVSSGSRLYRVLGRQIHLARLSLESSFFTGGAFVDYPHETKKHLLFFLHLRRGIRFPTMWYVRPAKPQISLRICAVLSEPLLVA